MSLSEVKPFFDNYRRDSFSHRVCDDLSEVILQFLPFKDKFRLECVSKQFQRTVFQKQYELIVDPFFGGTKKDIINLRTVLQKLPNIRCLRQQQFLKYNRHFLEDNAINSVIEFCDNLVEVKCDLSQMFEFSTKFVNKFGSKLVSFYAKSTDIPLIECFPNLQELKFLTYDWSYMTCVSLSTHVFNKLRKLSLRFDESFSETQTNKQLIAFRNLIANHKQLTHFSIELNVENHLIFMYLFQEISHLKDLIELKITDNFGIVDYILVYGLEKLSLNCLKLKSFKLQSVLIEDVSQELHFIDIFQRFKHLKRLDISLNISDSSVNMMSEESYHLYDSINKSIEGLKGLTHLIVSADNNHLVVPLNGLKWNFHKQLPKLQYLNIFGVFHSKDYPDYFLTPGH